MHTVDDTSKASFKKHQKTRLITDPRRSDAIDTDHSAKQAHGTQSNYIRRRAWSRLYNGKGTENINHADQH